MPIAKGPWFAQCVWDFSSPTGLLKIRRKCDPASLWGRQQLNLCGSKAEVDELRRLACNRPWLHKEDLMQRYAQDSAMIIEIGEPGVRRRFELEKPVNIERNHLARRFSGGGTQ